MKEKYVAPDLFFESFKLSQSIAAGCYGGGLDLIEMLNQAPENYFADFGSLICNTKLTSEDLAAMGFEGYCYTNGAMKVFTS